MPCDFDDVDFDLHSYKNMYIVASIQNYESSVVSTSLPGLSTLVI